MSDDTFVAARLAYDDRPRRPAPLVVSPATWENLSGLAMRGASVTAALQEEAARLQWTLAAEAKLRLAEMLYGAIAGPAREASRKRNAEARDRWRQRVLSDPAWHSTRPCAACGDPSPWFVCTGCSTGYPGGEPSPWRIRPEAAARIRAKMCAGAHVPRMPRG